MAMRKGEILIRVSGHEKATIEALAEQEKLAVGSLIRRMLLLEAERRGIALPNTDYRGKADVTQDD